jgi:hypothetical protein
MNGVVAFLSLFTSFGTLLCCALPALFVVLGLGAAFAGLVASVPQLIWLSENKLWLFAIGGVLLLAGGLLRWRAVAVECSVDPLRGDACKITRDWSKHIYIFSMAIYLVGAFFAFLAPRLF